MQEIVLYKNADPANLVLDLYFLNNKNPYNKNTVNKTTLFWLPSTPSLANIEAGPLFTTQKEENVRREWRINCLCHTEGGTGS